MTAVERRNNAHGFMVGAESSYGAALPAISTADDGVPVFEPSVVEVQHSYDGTREGKSSNGYYKLPNLPAAGRFGTGEARTYFRAPSSGVYDATTFSPVHRLLIGMGMEATFSAGPPALWRYAPESTGYTSLLIESYFHGHKAELKGAVGERLTIDFGSKGPPVWTFGYRGIMAANLTDSAVPAITYATGTMPTASGLTCTITNAATSAVLRVMSGTLTIERELGERGDLYSAGEHPGFDPGPLDIRLDLKLEATTLVGGSPFVNAANRRIDPAALYEAAEKVQAVVTYGASPAKVEFGNAAESAQFLAQPTQGTQGGIVTWDVSLGFRPATDASALDFYLDTV